MAIFGTLALSEQTLRGLAAMGFEEPTPVQAQTVPLLLEGRDVIAQALTGTGKTAAYGIPLVERVDPTRAVPQAVVMVPTRELAIQVTEHLARIGHNRGIVVLPIYGGQPIDRQLRSLRRGVHAIVATPGRLMDHMRRGSVDLGQVGLLVLDEADQMLEMGFIEDIEYILSHLPDPRVTALFSATMPSPIVQLARRHLRDPETVRLSPPREMTVPQVQHTYYIVPFPRKLDTLARVLDVERPERSIVFCATKRMVDEVVEGLQARGYATEGLHGDMSQAIRERVLRGFRIGQPEVLVATDVAARGLDVPEVSHVVNFDIPPDPEYYVHRIGRTARFGRAGAAITFVNPREMRELRAIERVTGARIRHQEVPTVAEAEERETQVLQDRLLDALNSGAWGRYRAVVEQMLDDHDPIDLAAAALALVAARGQSSTRRRLAPAAPRAEEPVPEPRQTSAIQSEQPRDEPRPEKPRSEKQRAGGWRKPAPDWGRGVQPAKKLRQKAGGAGPRGNRPPFGSDRPRTGPNRPR